MANQTAKTKAAGVQYTFAGEYYTGSKGDVQEQIKEYEIQIVFPGVTDKALSLFKTDVVRTHGYMYKAMLQRYPDFKAIRTHVIQDVTDLSGAEIKTNNIASMNRKQLAAYITENELGINPDVYGDIARLRCAIEQAEADPKGFEEVYKADLEAYEFNKELVGLNPPIEEKKNENDETEQPEEGDGGLSADEVLKGLE